MAKPKTKTITDNKETQPQAKDKIVYSEYKKDHNSYSLKMLYLTININEMKFLTFKRLNLYLPYQIHPYAIYLSFGKFLVCFVENIDLVVI